MPINTKFEFSVVQSLHNDELSWVSGIDRNRTAKQVTEGASIAASLGIQGAGIGVGATVGGTLGGAVLTGAAISATGIGLAVAGGTLAIGSAVASGVSAKKTYGHICSLNDLHNHRNGYTCTGASHGNNTANSPNHEYISDEILDYIIHQKKLKMGKKSLGAGGLGIMTGAYALGRYAFKSHKGEKRNMAAQMLATHLITHNCVLTEKIVTELLSLGEAELAWLKKQNSDVVGALLAKKIKSK